MGLGVVTARAQCAAHPNHPNILLYRWSSQSKCGICPTWTQTGLLLLLFSSRSLFLGLAVVAPPLPFLTFHRLTTIPKLSSLCERRRKEVAIAGCGFVPHCFCRSETDGIVVVYLNETEAVRRSHSPGTYLPTFYLSTFSCMFAHLVPVRRCCGPCCPRRQMETGMYCSRYGSR